MTATTESFSFQIATEQVLREVLSKPNAQVLLLCTAPAYAKPLGEAAKVTVLGALRDVFETTTTRPSVTLLELDVDAAPAAAKQLEVTRLPTLFAVLGGVFVDKVIGAVAQETLRSFVKQFATLRPVDGQQGNAPEEDDDVGEEEPEVCHKWLRIASDLLQKGSLDYAEKMFEKTLPSTKKRATRASCLAGLVLCDVVRDTPERADWVAELRGLNPRHLAVCLHDVVSLPALSSHRPLLTPEVSVKSLQPSFQQGTTTRGLPARVQMYLLHMLAARPEEALTELVKVAVLDRNIAHDILQCNVNHFGADHILILKTIHFLRTSGLSA